MEKNSIKKRSVEATVVFVLLAGIYMFPERIKYFSIVFVGLMVALALLKKWTFKKDYTILAILLYMFVSIFGMASNNVSVSNLLEFDVSLLMALLVYGFWRSSDIRKKQIIAIKYLGIICILGCILQLINIDLLRKINTFTLGPEKYAIFDMFYRGGSLVGFSFQTGVTGFYLAIITLFFLIEYLEEKQYFARKWGYLVATGGSLVLTFFTGKRIFILLVAVISLALICSYYRKNAFKILVVSLLILVGIFLLLNYTEYGQTIILKMSKIDPTTGRRGINEQMINWFWESPIYGNGVTSTLSLLGGYQNGHNIYIQILSESGILGFVIIVPIFAKNLFQSIWIYNKARTISIETKYCAMSIVIQTLFVGWGFTGNPLYDVYPLIVYMVAIGYMSEYRVEILRLMKG